ncbi:MAG: hypothetical protein M1122_01140 [Candidatus Marsarchaeota archaeon]|nr:hypothetical protein [Candidatus Marsarchaeota archaeon]
MAITRTNFYRKTSAPNTSIGPIGHAATASSGRIRGIFTDFILDDQKAIKAFSGIVREGIGIIDQENMAHIVIRDGMVNIQNEDNITRLNLRAVARREVLGTMRRILPKGASVEATLPLNVPKNSENGDLCIVYIGYNHDGRALTHKQRAALLQNISDSTEFRGNMAYYKNQLRFIADLGYSNRVFREGSVSNSPEILHSATRFLMETYGYSENSANHVLTNHDNVIAMIVHNDSVVGLSVVESAKIIVHGYEFKIAELTDSVVARNHRTIKDTNGNEIHIGGSLHLSLTSHVLTEVMRDGEYATVFSESNLNKRNSVLRSCALQGREFKGILPNQAKIDGKLASLGVFSINNISISEALRE